MKIDVSRPTCIATTALLTVTALTWVTACAGADRDPGASASLALAGSRQNDRVQYSMTTSLEAGQEAEHCLFVQAPAEGMLIQRDEIHFNTGSHHVLLYQTAYDAIPSEKLDGTPVDTRGVFDCSEGATSGWQITKLIAGSQNGQGESAVSFPDGIAVRVPPNTVLMINGHFINVTRERLTPEVEITLHTISEAALKQEGDLMFLYNPFIKVPQLGSARARMTCPVYQDVTLANVQSHMHRRGVGYRAMIEGQPPFYENDRWDDVPVKHFEPGLELRAGQRIDFACDYQNSEDRDVYQGPRTSDEMCILIGSYYPADYAMSACDAPDRSQKAADWVGQGTATCKQTLACFQASRGNGMQALTDCLLQADPSVAHEASTLLRCSKSAQNPLIDCAAEVQACVAK